MIKVCGMRDAKNIREIEALGIDMMGFIFWPKSKRYVGESLEDMPNHAKRVGVFVDEEIEQVKQIADNYSLDIIQLHGSEPPEYAKGLNKWKVIKAFNIATKEDLEATKPYEGIADYFLFDTKGQSVGGNGEKFDWSVLDAYDGETPFLLSGGIGPDDAEHINAFHHPKCIGIDLNSRFETAPGLKNVDKIKRFLEKVKR